MFFFMPFGISGILKTAFKLPVPRNIQRLPSKVYLFSRPCRAPLPSGRKRLLWDGVTFGGHPHPA